MRVTNLTGLILTLASSISLASENFSQNGARLETLPPGKAYQVASGTIDRELRKDQVEAVGNVLLSHPEETVRCVEWDGSGRQQETRVSYKEIVKKIVQESTFFDRRNTKNDEEILKKRLYRLNTSMSVEIANFLDILTTRGQENLRDQLTLSVGEFYFWSSFSASTKPNFFCRKG